MIILEELQNSKCTLKSRVTRTELSFLDLGSNLDIEFNGFSTLATYHGNMNALFIKFKTALEDLVSNSSPALVEQSLIDLLSRVTELDILLNPKNPEILLAQINIAGNFTRKLEESYELESVKKKSFNF
jgi:hypothetical protein